MYPYVEQIFSDLSQLPATELSGFGGYLRIKSDADSERILDFLTEERDAAQKEVESLLMPPRLLSFSVPMQILLLTELLLAMPHEPIDIHVLGKVQGGQAYVAERLEEAANALVMFAPRSLEVVAKL